jgi:hypothetical protein
MGACDTCERLLWMGGGGDQTSAVQCPLDPRIFWLRTCSKEKKLMKSMKFPKELDVAVDLKKVNMDVIKPWIAKRVTELLDGLEDEVLIGLVYNQLEQPVRCANFPLPPYSPWPRILAQLNALSSPLS